MSEKAFSISGPNLAGGYYSQSRGRQATELAPPSINVRLTRTGGAYTRPGYVDTAWNLANDNNPAMSYHMARYNITFFALSTKVYYIEHDRSNAVVDTGLTLTAGTTTRFAEFAGIIYCTNPTDGVRRIHVMRLNGAVSAGAATITVDLDGAVRLSRFTLTTDNLRVRGTNEAYNAVSTSTGALTLVGTASQAYTDNDIAIVTTDISATSPKGSKIVFWKESMNVIGTGTQATSASVDVPTNTLHFGQFVTASTIENLNTFSGGTSGTELVGKGGVLTNIVATRDYIYLFKEDETYFISVSDVNASSGARPPQLLSSLYGCNNEDCAVDMAGFLVFLTKNRRIIKTNIRVEGGSSVLFPDDSFDAPIRELLDNLDTGQTDAHMFYWSGGKLLFVECNVGGERITLIYDNNLQVWLPPDTNKSFRSYFEKQGNLFSTARNDDTVFQTEFGTSDQSVDIESVIASGIFEFENGRVTCDWQDVEVSGAITQPTEVTFEPIVNGTEGTPKFIDQSQANFTSTEGAIGSVTIGDLVLGGSGGDDLGIFDQKLAIYPSIGQDVQLIFSVLGDGHFIRLDSWKINALVFDDSLLTLR